MKVHVERVRSGRFEIEARGVRTVVDRLEAEGGAGDGFRPVELMLGSLGACMLGTMLTFAENQAMRIDDVSVSLTAAIEEHPERIAGVAMTMRIDGDITDRQLQSLQRVAQRCKIHNTLHHGAETSLSVDRGRSNARRADQRGESVMTNASGRSTVVGIAQTLISQNILSRSLHGNISLRLDDERILMTGSSLVGLAEEDLAVLSLEGEVHEGHVAPAEHEIIRMHTAVYKERPDVGCIIHTHSPHATAFAVIGQGLPVVAESLARWGVTDPIPLAKWAPRGSEAAVSFILDAVRAAEATPAVLLENHGVLNWGGDGNEALRRAIAIEENAQLAVLAASIGGANEMSPENARLAVARKEAFLSGGGATS